jgi:hypothetical protein
MSVHDVAGVTHCWSPIIDGKVIQYKGEPPLSVRAAKKASAKEINVPVQEINFVINR